MVLEKNYLFFKTLRVALDDEKLASALLKREHAYVTGISYTPDLAGEGVTVKTKKTPIIDTKVKTDEEFLAMANDTTRNEIRRTFKISELSFRLPDENRKGICRLYGEFEKAGGRSARAFSYFRESIFAGAYYGGKLMAAIICYDAKPYVRVYAIVSLRKTEGEIRKYSSFATRRLVFELAKYAMGRGYDWLDLGSVNLKDQTKAGIDAFKLSFGARLVHEYTYTYKSKLFRYASAVFNKRG